MRRSVVITGVVLAVLAAVAAWVAFGTSARGAGGGRSAGGDAAAIAPRAVDRSSPRARALAEAAMAQVGVTTSYDPAYVIIPYPGGDVASSTGVCTDMVVRAFRAVGVDLQVRVHEDMGSAWDEYPRKWALSAPDSNIDHRRVPNLQRFFERAGWEQPVTGSGADYLPGDVVTWDVFGRPHTGIVSTKLAPDGTRWCIAHNIGRGAEIEDMLFEYEITGHYRPF